MDKKRFYLTYKSRSQSIVEGSWGRQLKLGLLALLHNTALKERTHSQLRKLAGTMEDAACWLHQGSCLASYLLQRRTAQPENGATLSRLCPLASVNDPNTICTPDTSLGQPDLGNPPPETLNSRLCQLDAY